MLVELINAVHRLFQHGFDVQRARPFLLLFGNAENRRFRFIKNLQGFAALGGEGVLGDILGHMDQLPQDAALAHDIRVGVDIGSTGRIAGQFGQIVHAAHIVQLVQMSQRLRHGDQVTGLFLFHQLPDDGKDLAMLLAIEIFRADPLGDVIPGAVIQQQATQNGLFRLQGIGGDPEVFRQVFIQRQGIIHGATNIRGES